MILVPLVLYTWRYLVQFAIMMFNLQLRCCNALLDICYHKFLIKYFLWSFFLCVLKHEASIFCANRWTPYVRNERYIQMSLNLLLYHVGEILLSTMPYCSTSHFKTTLGWQAFLHHQLNLLESRDSICCKLHGFFITGFFVMVLRFEKKYWCQGGRLLFGLKKHSSTRSWSFFPRLELQHFVCHSTSFIERSEPLSYSVLDLSSLVCTTVPRAFRSFYNPYFFVFFSIFLNGNISPSHLLLSFLFFTICCSQVLESPLQSDHFSWFLFWNCRFRSLSSFLSAFNRRFHTFVQERISTSFKAWNKQ